MNRPYPSRQEVLANGLAGYVDTGVLSEAQATLIMNAIAQGKNIVVTGSGGETGKTTLCNLLINEWSAQHPDGRMLVVEQIREISSTAPNVHFQLEPESMIAGEWAALFGANQPNAVCVGEIRGALAAEALLDFWKNKSRAGFATVYGSDPAVALSHLGKMLNEGLRQHGAALVVEAVDYVLHLEKTGPGKRVCRGIWMIDSYDITGNTFTLVPAI